MAGYDGVKRWWANNPVLSCALGSVALMAFLFLFPFAVAAEAVAEFLLALFSWVPAAFVGFFNFFEASPKPIFAIVGFFTVFFFCLGCKRPSKSVDRLGMGSTVVLTICTFVMVLGVALSSEPERASDYMRSLDARISVSLDREHSMRACLFGDSRLSTPLKTSASASARGPVVFTCERGPDDRQQLVERALSEVNLTELACPRRRCTNGLWQVAYNPESQVVVLTAQTKLARMCRNVVGGLPVSALEATVNGRPARHSECRSGVNTIQVTYAPSWLKPAKE